MDYEFGHELSPLTYQSQSTDDVTAAEAAQQLGYELIYRDMSGAKIFNHITSQTEDIKMLKTNKFTSARKRMSVLAQLSNGEYRVYCKGADSVILKKLSTSNDEFLIETTQQHLKEASSQGLRTLCASYRTISHDQAQMFLERYAKADVA